MFKKLKIDDQGPIAEIILSAPEEGNGFGEILHGEFPVALAQIAGATHVRVLVLRAEGKLFSAGGSFDYLGALSESEEMRRRTYNEGREMFRALNNMPVPIVAAVQGHAMGVGATIAASCDAVVAWKGAKIGDPHVQVGLVAGDGGAVSWTASVGLLRAKRALLTGDPITAEQGYHMGLVTDLVDEPDQAYPAARRLAERIAALPPLAVQGTKRVFNTLVNRGLDEALTIGLMSETDTLRSDDFKEAIKATVEKRTGVYKGI